MGDRHREFLRVYLLKQCSSIPFRKKRGRKTFKTMKELIEAKEAPEQIVEDQPIVSERPMMFGLYGQVKFMSSVLERAQEVQSKLNAKFPSFIKPMIRSNVTRGFWLSLPNYFCDLYLPRCDRNIILVDENQEEYSTKYLFCRRGLSAGWRGFSIAHNLVEGDVLVFHFVAVLKMKVYIVRSSHLDAVDAALGLMQLEAHAKFLYSEQLKQDSEHITGDRQKLQKHLLKDISHDHFEKDRHSDQAQTGHGTHSKSL